MGRESSHGKELFNLPPLARHLSGSAFCILDWKCLSRHWMEACKGLVVKINLLNFHVFRLTDGVLSLSDVCVAMDLDHGWASSGSL